jgi:hypothetical protein
VTGATVPAVISIVPAVLFCALAALVPRDMEIAIAQTVATRIYVPSYLKVGCPEEQEIHSQQRSYPCW